ncbi:MAG: potassium channel protein [Gammaproteobacteria bacterium]|nr:MAG: potassium channel protein [Gammaproteobacteria bacterium]
MHPFPDPEESSMELLLTGPLRFHYLLVSLLLLIIVYPLVVQTTESYLLIDILLSLTLIAGIWVVSERHAQVALGILLSLLTLATLWYAAVTFNPLVALTSLVLGFVFFSYTISLLLIHLFRQPHVTLGELSAAVSCYLLLAINGAFLFAIIDYLLPGSFVALGNNVPLPWAGSPVPHFSNYLYFSITSLTTLGYGDIVPVTPPARVFSSLESAIGQIYLTVLVARLVGLHISRTTRYPE